MHSAPASERASQMDEKTPPLFERINSATRRIAERVALGQGRVRDEQQLLSVVDLAAEQDLLEEVGRDYIHSIVEFGDTLVREVMVPRTDMVTVDAEASVASALEVLLNSRHSRIPVIDGDADEVVGIIYLRNAASFLLRHADEADETPVTRIMKPAMFVPEVQRADRLLRHMQQVSNHLALVVDEYGGISGLVSLEDLIEELLGDINDEHDRDVPDITETAEGSFLVNARVPVDRLGELFGIDLDDEDVDTVGGLFAKWLGRLPEVGDRVSGEGIELEAVQTERRKKRLITAHARALPQPDEESEESE